MRGENEGEGDREVKEGGGVERVGGRGGGGVFRRGFGCLHGRV